MSIATVVTRGYGSFGSIGEVVTRGYIAGVAVSDEPRGSTRYDQRHRHYDFGEHYPGLKQEDKDRIDEIIAALTPAAKKRLEGGRPSKTLRKKIAKVLPEYAYYIPKTSAEYRAEAERDMQTRVDERTARLMQEDEEALIMVLMLAE